MDGLSLKNFPRDLSKDEILSFLVSKGLPQDFQAEFVALSKYGNVEVSNLKPALCQTLLRTYTLVKLAKSFMANLFIVEL